VDKALKAELKQVISDWIKNASEWPNSYIVKDAAFRVIDIGNEMKNIEKNGHPK
jgi:hypothetical protein